MSDANGNFIDRPVSAKQPVPPPRSDHYGIMGPDGCACADCKAERAGRSMGLADAVRRNTLALQLLRVSAYLGCGALIGHFVAFPLCLLPLAVAAVFQAISARDFRRTELGGWTDDIHSARNNGYRPYE